jgi:hypothetical protein
MSRVQVPLLTQTKGPESSGFPGLSAYSGQRAPTSAPTSGRVEGSAGHVGASRMVRPPEVLSPTPSATRPDRRHGQPRRATSLRSGAHASTGGTLDLNAFALTAWLIRPRRDQSSLHRRLIGRQASVLFAAPQSPTCPPSDLTPLGAQSRSRGARCPRARLCRPCRGAATPGCLHGLQGR